MGREAKSAKAKAEENKHLRRLGKHLKELRETKNLTPQDLADKLGVTPQYIYMIESGKAKPSEKRLNELAAALGDLADEFLSTAVERVEDEFAARLKEAGLSAEEIDEAARRVSARAKEDVVLGNEPLRVARGPVSDEDMLGAKENNEEMIVMETFGSYEMDKASASEYAKSVRDDFVAGSSRPRAPVSSRRPSREKADMTISAGREARIVVSRKLTREEIKALQDIGRVIEHLLKK